jgi:ketosteroid isomerase-like protein
MTATITRLAEAMQRHDPHGMAALMAPDYRSEQPVHPNRGFGGTAQVVENWTAMFGAAPDLVVELLGETCEGATSSSEWRWHGHHHDGSPFEMRGMIVTGLREDGLIQWARLYMEPVEEGGADIPGAVRQLTEAEG